MKKLRLPSLKGKFGDWVYFTAFMKAEDVADPKRIKTVSESEDLYPKNIREVLQREIDSKRINKISEYLISQKERFLNTIIVAIHNGNPTWGEIKIHDNFQVDGDVVEDDEILYLDGRLGVLTLNGDEKIFVLDGQHRLKGIREALSNNSELGKEDVSLTFVVHEDALVERTRRLFTVLNRYAEKPKKAEIIIMDEDDSAAILTRKLVLEHEIFQLKNAISKTRDMAMPSTDVTSFTTLVCLYEITKTLIDFNLVHPKNNSLKRKSTEFLDELYYEKVLPFWENLFYNFPIIVAYIAGDDVPPDFKRNKENGGSFLLRPLGQMLIAELYKSCLSTGNYTIEQFFEKLITIDFTLGSSTWNYILWESAANKIPSKVSTKFLREYMRYLMGLSHNHNYILKEYVKLRGVEETEKESINLPDSPNPTSPL